MEVGDAVPCLPRGRRGERGGRQQKAGEGVGGADGEGGPGGALVRGPGRVYEVGHQPWPAAWQGPQTPPLQPGNHVPQAEH